MDPRPSKLKQAFLLLAIFLISIVYLFLRLIFPETIEFGYDQPLLTMSVLDFLKNPSFIDSYKYVGINPWGAPSWGPAQLFFWAPFLLVTKEPISISQLSVLFNLIGVVAIYFLGKKFFSPTVGILSALTVTTHPWSVIFSRMIYQPTPVITLVVVCMFLSFYIFENPKTKVVAVLVLLWAFIYQIYIHTFSFVVSSFGFLLINLERISKRYFFFGVTLAILFFLPSIYFFVKNPDQTNNFSRVTNKFSELRSQSPYSLGDIAFEFFGVMGGGRFNWQLGYGYEDFIKSFPMTSSLEFLGFYLVVFTFFYHLIKVVTDKEINTAPLAYWAYLVFNGN